MPTTHRIAPTPGNVRWGAFDAGFAPVATIDATLHAERIGPGKAKRTSEATVASLPAGAMFARAGRAWLRWPQDGAGQGLRGRRRRGTSGVIAAGRREKK